MLSIDQLKNMSEASRNSALQMAEAALEGQEKMIRMNINAIQEFIKVGGEQFKEGCSEMTQRYSVEAWPRVIMGNIQRGTVLNLSWLEITNRMQRELSCVLEENIRAFSNGPLEVAEKYSGGDKVGHGARRRPNGDSQA